MGILDGLAYGLAGGVQGGANAAGQVADDQIKLNNQQLLQKQLADLHTQEEQSVASYKNNLELSNQAATRSRLASANVTDEGTTDPESGSTVKGGFNYGATRDKLIAQGDYGPAADLDKAQGDKTVGYGGVLVDASGKPIYDNSLGRNEIGMMRARSAEEKAQGGGKMDPIKKVQLQGVIAQDLDKEIANAVGTPPLYAPRMPGEKPLPNAPYIAAVRDIAQAGVHKEWNDGDGTKYPDFVPHLAYGKDQASKLDAGAKRAVAAKFGKLDLSDPQQQDEYADQMRGRTNAFLAHFSGRQAAPGGAMPAGAPDPATPPPLDGSGSNDPDTLAAEAAPGSAPPAPAPILRAAMRGRQQAPIIPVAPTPRKGNGRTPVPVSAQGVTIGQ